MKIFPYLLLVGIVVLIYPIGLMAEKGLTDPYEIMNKYYQAIGGLEKAKSVKSEY